jgi:uncharacterized protein
MQQAPVQIESSSDDRLWVLLGYILSPWVPIIILFLADKKDRPFIKAHNMQALLLGVAEAIVGGLLYMTIIGGCIASVVFIVVNVYFALKANKGEVFDIPVISNFVRTQGW